MSYPDKIRLAWGKNLQGVRTIERSWDRIVERFSRPHQVFKDKAASISAPNILGGPTDDKAKEYDNVLGRSLITLDYDGLGPDVDVEDFEFALDMLGYAAIAYTTFSHKTDRADGCARLRVIVPLAEEISKEAYPAAARALADEIGFDAASESFSAAQVMFLPSCMEGFEDEAWTHVVEGDPYPVQAAWEEVGAGGGDLDDDFMLDIVYEPLDLTDAEVDKALEMFEAEGLDYDDWLMVGLALWHQYRGDTGDAGFGRWLRWSEKSSKHDPKMMRTKWKSGGGRAQPTTMASVMARAGGVSAVREALFDDGHVDLDVDLGGDDSAEEVSAPAVGSGSLALVDKFSEAAQAIEGLADYEKLKQALLRVPERRLGSDYRGMIAEEVFISWGKGAGLTKSDIKKAFMPEKGRGAIGGAGGGVARGDEDAEGRRAVSEEDCWDSEKPRWLQGWVFDERDAEFIDVTTGHAIKRESFRMKYDRMPECEEHEVDAVTLASKIFPIPTVSGRMYWPGNGRIFVDSVGLSYLNSWGGGGGVEPAPAGSFEIGDDSVEGQACRVFLDHLERTVKDERERRLMLDWMAWTYSKPGSRVRWALLLWGIEGNGKSYFHRVLTRLMGRDSKTVAASTIEERFTDWAEGCRLVGIEEIRVSGTNKWRTLDKMKPFISNDEIQVEGKGKAAKVVPNFASYMLFTNHADAIPVGDGDRRYFVVFTRHRTKQDLLDEHSGEEGVGRYFQTLFDVSLAGVAGIGRMLLDHEYSEEFDPHGRAPDSSGKQQMRLLHVSEEDEAVIEALDRYRGPYINDTILDLTELQEACEFDAEITLPQTRSLSHKLVNLGFSKGGRIKARKKMRTIWYRENKISYDDAVKAVRAGGVDKIDPDVPF